MLGRILLIEDSEGEALLVKAKLAEAGLDDPLYWIHEPETAMAYVAGEGFYANRARYPLPDIILLDLGLPRVDGFELLKFIRSQPEIGGVLVIVLTAEMDPKRVQRAYQLGANSFLSKQANVEEFRNFVEFFRSFSRVANALPRSARDIPAMPGQLIPIDSVPKPTENGGSAAA